MPAEAAPVELAAPLDQGVRRRAGSGTRAGGGCRGGRPGHLGDLDRGNLRRGRSTARRRLAAARGVPWRRPPTRAERTDAWSSPSRTSRSAACRARSPCWSSARALPPSSSASAPSPARRCSSATSASKPGGAISGRVVDGAGRGLDGVLITNGSTGDEPGQFDWNRYDFFAEGAASARSRPDGSFLIGGVAEGFPRVWASGEGLARELQARPVEVRAGQESMGVELVLEPLPDEIPGARPRRRHERKRRRVRQPVVPQGIREPHDERIGTRRCRGALPVRLAAGHAPLARRQRSGRRARMRLGPRT